MNLLQFYFFFIFTHYDILATLICTSNAPVQYFRLPKLHKCNYHRQLNDDNKKSKIVSYEVFKPNIIEYSSEYYIKIWRIYVTIGVTLFYIFIGRSIWMVFSPKTFFNKENRNPRNRNPIFVRTKNHSQGEDYQGVELQDFRNEHRRSLVVD
uniref:Uncharacterized protein n=1 Tax=Heterorhabditis bacteriophora TaxID=37862 RepID=A0A1I7X619_HETBA